MKKGNIYFWYGILIVVCFFTACENHSTKKMKIAVSKNNKDKTYTTWLSKLYPAAEFINMYEMPIDSAEILLADCSGILITGGNDVSPGRYGKSDEIEKCGEFDEHRDSLEFLMIQYAMNNQIPLLGICRGEQILNVVNGGTLYTDIPTDIGENVTHRITDSIVFHDIKIKEGSLLHKICGVTEGNVNSIHHQSVDRIAKDFIPVAFSEDGVIEAIEPENSKSFILGVQWHPEKLDSANKMSYPIGKYFIERAKEYSK